MSVRLVPSECVRLAHFIKANALDATALNERIPAPQIARKLWQANLAAFVARYGHLTACHDIARDTRLGYFKLNAAELTSVAATRDALQSYLYQVDDLPADIARLCDAAQRRIDALDPPAFEE